MANGPSGKENTHSSRIHVRYPAVGLQLLLRFKVCQHWPVAKPVPLPARISIRFIIYLHFSRSSGTTFALIALPYRLCKYSNDEIKRSATPFESDVAYVAQLPNDRLLNLSVIGACIKQFVYPVPILARVSVHIHTRANTCLLRICAVSRFYIAQIVLNDSSKRGEERQSCISCGYRGDVVRRTKDGTRRFICLVFLRGIRKRAGDTWYPYRHHHLIEAKQSDETNKREGMRAPFPPCLRCLPFLTSYSASSRLYRGASYLRPFLQTPVLPRAYLRQRSSYSDLGRSNTCANLTEAGQMDDGKSKRWEGRIITWFVSTWVTIRREGPI